MKKTVEIKSVNYDEYFKIITTCTNCGDKREVKVTERIPEGMIGSVVETDEICSKCGMTYEEKVEAIKEFLRSISVELIPVETSGGAYIEVRDKDTSQEYGFKELK